MQLLLNLSPVVEATTASSLDPPHSTDDMSVLKLLAMHILGLRRNESECWSPSCIGHAMYLKKSMDLHVNPCDNFFQFACGQSINSTTIPDDDPLDIFENNMINILKEFIPSDEPKIFKIGKQLFQTCINDAITFESYNKFIDYVKEEGYPPMPENIIDWNECEFDWTKDIYKWNDLGFSANYILDVSVGKNSSNPNNPIVYINPPFENSPFHARNYSNEEYYRKVELIMSSHLSHIGVTPKRAELEVPWAAYFSFMLHKIYFETKSSKDNNPVCVTVKKLSKVFPSIPWKEYLNHLLPSTIQLDDNNVVCVKNPQFINQLDKLLKRTRKRSQANYIFTQVISSFLDIFNHLGAFSEKRCLNLIQQKLPLSYSALYIRNELNKSSSKNTSIPEMMTDIITELNNSLQKFDWFDEKVKQTSSEKLSLMTSEILYPTNFLNNTNILEFYKDLELSNNSFLDILKVHKFDRDQKFSQLRKSFEETKLINYDISKTTQFFSNLRNKEFISDEYLRNLYFSTYRPNYMNYGIIGSTIGRKVAHELGFVVLKNHCSAKEYSRFFDEKDEVYMMQKIVENVKDSIGYKMAYLAYQNWSEKNKPEPILPILGYNAKQLFWISAASQKCSIMQEENRRFSSANKHSSYEYSIVGAFSKTAEFAKDFNCPVGSEMIPKEKCLIV